MGQLLSPLVGEMSAKQTEGGNVAAQTTTVVIVGLRPDDPYRYPSTVTES